MKKARSFFAVVLSVMMAISTVVIPASAVDIDVWDGTADTSWYNDALSEFTLTTAEQFAGLASLVNSGSYNFSGKTVKLGVDVQLQSNPDMANYASWSTSVAPANTWVPIGWYNVGSFRGTFDGQGHTISGMYINDSAGSLYKGRPALFGFVIGATLRNFTIEKSYSNGKNCTGIVAAYNETTGPSFDNITVSDSTVVGITDGAALLMGKTGAFSSLTITNCNVSGNVTSQYAGGGLIGYISGGTLGTINISGCTVNVNVTRTYTAEDAIIGSGGLIGLLGRDTASSLTSLNVTGTTVNSSVTGKRTVGGVIGTVSLNAVQNIVFDDVDVTVDVNCHDSTINISDIGAVIGYLRVLDLSGKVKFKDMSVTGTVRAGQNSGGLIGRINAQGTFVELNEIEVDTVDMDVDFIAKKGSANAQAFGGVIGLAQNLIGTLTVTGFTTSNTYTTISADGVNSLFGGIVGQSTVGFGTVNVSDSTFNDTFTNLGKQIGGLFGGAGDMTAAAFSGVTVNDTIGATEAVGGFFGRSKAIDATFTDCTVTGSYSGTNYVGGFIGDNNATVTSDNVNDFIFTNCYVAANVSGSVDVGGFIGDFDPTGGNDAATATGSSGTVAFTNCVVKGNRTATTNTGGLFGRVYPKQLSIDVDCVTILGACTGTNVGALSGNFATASSSNGTININNLYYNGMANGKLTPSFNNASGYKVLGDCVFYTPGSDSTPGASKEASARILYLIEDTKDLTVNFPHTCEPVVIDDMPGSMTLGCEIIGCVNHNHVITDGSIGESIGASIRTGTNAGLRFGFRMDESLKSGEGESINIGMILIPTSMLGGEELTLDTPKIARAKATKVFSSTNINYLDGALTYTGVLADMPESAKDREITARAYVEIGESVYYSAAVTASYNYVASLID